MRKIQDITLKTPSIELQKAEIIAELQQDDVVRNFISIHHLAEAQIIEAANAFYEYQKYREAAASGSYQMPPDKFEGQLFINDYGKVEFGYRYTEQYQKLQQLQKYIHCLYMDEHMLSADIKDFAQYKYDSPVMAEVGRIAQSIRKGSMKESGLFIAGSNGVGKTHMLMALAKEYAARQQSTTIIFVPEFIRQLKQNPYQANDMITKLQKAAVLMLDDIGSEMQTSFSRDEVLLPIINARLNNNKTTYFSSNFTLADLEQHFTQTQYGEKEPLKAKRMMERITALSTYVELLGENRRRQ